MRWTYFNKKRKKKLENEDKKEEETKKKFEEIVGIEFSINYYKKLILYWDDFKENNLTNLSHPSKESYPKNSIEFN